MTILDQLSINLVGASVILGLLTVVIVGSQPREDARSIAIGTLSVLVPMLLVSCASLALPGRPGGFKGGPGMVAICAALTLAVGLGYRIAPSGQTISQATSKDKKVGPGFADDDLA